MVSLLCLRLGSQGAGRGELAGECGSGSGSGSPKSDSENNEGHVHRQKLQATEILRATGFNLGAGISVSGSRGRIGYSFGLMIENFFLGC